jgi:hypothetical protein
MGYTFFLDLMAGLDTFGSHSIAQDHISNDENNSVKDGWMLLFSDGE